MPKNLSRSFNRAKKSLLITDRNDNWNNFNVEHISNVIDKASFILKTYISTAFNSISKTVILNIKL